MYLNGPYGEKPLVKLISLPAQCRAAEDRSGLKSLCPKFTYAQKYPKKSPKAVKHHNFEKRKKKTSGDIVLKIICSKYWVPGS